jgi:hypothetical protein
MPQEEVVVPLPSPRSVATRTTHVRGSWICSSQRSLREQGVLERYFSLMSADDRAKLTAPPAGEWLPIEIAMAHYTACDKLELSVSQIIEMGRSATNYSNAPVMNVTAKLATGAGATPWIIFEQVQRFWDRVWMGGAVGVTKLGPKELRVELVGWPMSGFRYTRVAMRGVIVGTCELFCSKCYAQEIENLCTPLTLGYRVAWA